MVAPLILLGAAGALGAQAAMPFYERYRDDVRQRGQARRNERVYGDLLADPSAGPTDFARAGLAGGLLGGEDVIGTMQQGRQLDIAQGRLGLARQQFEHGRIMDRVGTIPTLQGEIPSAAIMGALFEGESSFNPRARSWKGALGLGQIMPANVPSWARREFPELAEFTDQTILDAYQADPVFQEQLAERSFMRILDEQGGSLPDAFSVWHSGVPLEDAIAQGRNDINPETGEGVTTEQYVRQMMSRVQRQAYQLQEAAQVEAETREAQIAGLDARRPLDDAADAAQDVLDGIEVVQRFGNNLQAPEAQAAIDQMRMAQEELFFEWKNRVYGEAEPPPAVLQRLEEAFRPLQTGRLDNLERTRRAAALMQAELRRRADYEDARAQGAPRRVLERLNFGRLTREERAMILDGGLEAGGWETVEPPQPQAEELPPGRARGR